MNYMIRENPDQFVEISSSQSDMVSSIEQAICLSC